jgi:hypothetical protein
MAHPYSDPNRPSDPLSCLPFGLLGVVDGLLVQPPQPQRQHQLRTLELPAGSSTSSPSSSSSPSSPSSSSSSALTCHQQCAHSIPPPELKGLLQRAVHRTANPSIARVMHRYLAHSSRARRSRSLTRAAPPSNSMCIVHDIEPRSPCSNHNHTQIGQHQSQHRRTQVLKRHNHNLASLPRRHTCAECPETRLEEFPVMHLEHDKAQEEVLILSSICLYPIIMFNGLTSMALSSCCWRCLSLLVTAAISRSSAAIHSASPAGHTIG